MLGDEGEKAPRGGAGGHVVGMDGQLDVQDLGVGAQHVPRHVDFDEHQFLIDYLQSTNKDCVSVTYSRANLPKCAVYVQIVLPPAPFPSLSGWPQNTLSVSTEKYTEKEFQ